MSEIQPNKIDFDLLKVWNEIPDQKHNYVRCWLYKANFSARVYIRADTKLFKHKIMRLSDININGKNIAGHVSIKEIQAHPVNSRMIHVDLFLIEDNPAHVEITQKAHDRKHLGHESRFPGEFRVMMPIKYVDADKSAGIKLGGFLYQTSRAIEVRVAPQNLVPFVTASIEHMKAGDSIRVDAIDFPKGVTPIRRDISIAKLEGNKGG